MTPQRRHELRDEERAQLEPLLPPQRPTTGRPAKDHRTVLNGIVWVLVALQTEAAHDGDVDGSLAMIDGSSIRSHQQAAGAPKKGASPPRRSGAAAGGGAASCTW